ncbi:MAG TPA: response regulator transcription factor [Candidatus Saccharimonadales bacterium]|nr:response regulator transcription factor [Candidatus Saccharimonadales bacterium]
MQKISVLIAEDHQIVRQGLHSLLKHEPDIIVVAEAETGRQAVQLAKKLRPDVVVMDIAMPSLNGLEATRQILKELPASRVLMLSAHSDDAYVDQVTQLGASGFLLKQASAHNLATAIREAHKGKTFFSPLVAKYINARENNSVNPNGEAKKKNNRLSSREIEVLQLIAEGKPNKQVAAELGVSFKTVDKHRQHLMGKLNIHDIAGLTRYAISEGIIESRVRITIT